MPSTIALADQTVHTHQLTALYLRAQARTVRSRIGVRVRVP